ncbi:MAG: ATP-binding protein [Alphaproteobacteria bacterium]|nr:ATP-binding protein [Alphaproteobacteria bacterium]
MKLRKAGGNWVDGDRFFDREVELEALAERVRHGNNTLLTAQRRMGKTSLVRELLRRLKETGEIEPIFVDLEAARDPADAIAEISVQAKEAMGAWARVKRVFGNVLRQADRIDELAVADVKVKLRAGIDAGNWQQRGDAVLAALAESDRPVVLAMDELPILVNRLLKGDRERITAEGRQVADAFMSWLRKNGQAHRGRMCMIVSGSVGLEPVLAQAGLSAQANIFSPFDLKPWSEDIAVSCLGALAESYGIDLPEGIRRDMCRRLRSCIPHHVQMFFDKMHEHLRRAGKSAAAEEDVENVYLHEMLGVRGQLDLQHYEGRLEAILGRAGDLIALELLTAAAVNGILDDSLVERYRAHYSGLDTEEGAGAPDVDDVLHLLEHDGYLERQNGGYRFVSGLLEDWWSNRHGRHFVPVFGPGPNKEGVAGWP